jgi:diguanylate cyclase (GGDEF)-like protein
VDPSVRATAFNRLGSSAVILDDQGVIVDSNESWRLFGALNGGSQSETGSGVNYLDVCDRAAINGDPDATQCAVGIRQILSGERERIDLEYPCASPTEDRWFLMQASSAPVANGAGVVVFHIDITARRVLSDRLAALADVDELTGLPNRRAAVRYLGDELAAARLTGDKVWVLFLDMDRFKEVNDVHGHHVGDELLVKVAVRGRRVLRERDRLCRLGGDEFILVCPALDSNGARALADRIRTVMAAPFQIDDLTVQANISIGVAESTPDSTIEDVLVAADAAMYVDKRGAALHRQGTKA